MIGLGTIINTASIIGAGIVGHFAGNLFNSEQQESVGRACGISVLFIAIAGTMEGMLKLDSGSITAVNTMLVVLCIVLGTIIGEALGIEHWFISFGEWLKRKTGSEGDRNFVNACDDLFTGKGMCLFRDPCLCFRRKHDTSGPSDLSGNDTAGDCGSFHDRIHSDLLCRGQSGMGHEASRSQHAAGGGAGGDRGPSSVLEYVRIIKSDPFPYDMEKDRFFCCSFISGEGNRSVPEVPDSRDGSCCALSFRPPETCGLHGRLA